MSGVDNFYELDLYGWMQTALDCSIDPVVVKSLDHRFVLVNKVFCTLSNLPAAEIIGTNAAQLSERIKAPIDPVLLTFLSPAIEHLGPDSQSTLITRTDEVVDAQRREFKTTQIPLRHEDGTPRLLLLRSELVQSNAQQNTRIAEYDAFESRSNETLWPTDAARSWLSEGPDLVAVSDGEGNFVYCNHTLGEFLGLPPGNLTTKDAVNDTLHQLRKSVRAHQSHQRSLGGSSDQDLTLTDLHGSDHTFRIFELPVANAARAENSLNTLHILRDVTFYRSTIDSLNRERDELLQRLSFLSALSNFTLKLANKMELIPLLQHIADQLLSLFQADAAFISLMHESTDYIEMVAASGTIYDHKLIKHKIGEGMAGSAWEKNEIQIIEDYQEYTAKMSGFSEIRQGLAIPISCNGQFAAVVGITYDSISGGLFNQIDLVKQFAQLVGMAIENTRLIAEKDKEISRTEALNQLSQTMFANTDLESVLQEITNTVVKVVDAKIVDIHTVDDNQSLVSKAFARTVDFSDNSLQTVLLRADQLEDPMLQLCLEQSKTAFITRRGKHPRHNQARLDIRRQLGLGATMVVPLIHAESVWGVMAIHRDQEQVDFDNADINHVNAIANQASITLHRHGLLKTVQHQAHHDSLTTLSNRFYFENLLASTVTKSSQTGQHLGVLFLDLDGFKSINDTLGHAVGDKLLVFVAKRLKNCLKEGDLLARMGGDEFALLINTTASGNEATTIAKRILSKLKEDFVVDGVTLRIGASIGISQFPENGTSAEELLKNADIAMYQAKDNGKGNFQCFSKSLARKYQQRIKTENDLKVALDQDQFVLYYQPQVNVETGKATAVEALIRWNHPERGLLSPDEFVTIAEDSGMIVGIGEWVLDEACRQTAQWHEEGLHDLGIAVNISSHQFAIADFVEVVKNALKKNSLAPLFLELEVTESFVMKNIESVAQKLNQLRDYGIEISVDDFGTGYSSLMYLEELPLDKLKIDRSFVTKVKNQSPSMSIANIIILMANTFDLTTIAEGVETQQQYENVKKLGADFIQGFFYSKPVSAQKLPGVIHSINNQARSGVVPLKSAV